MIYGRRGSSAEIITSRPLLPAVSSWLMLFRRPLVLTGPIAVYSRQTKRAAPTSACTPGSEPLACVDAVRRPCRRSPTWAESRQQVVHQFNDEQGEPGDDRTPFGRDWLPLAPPSTRHGDIPFPARESFRMETGCLSGGPSVWACLIGPMGADPTTASSRMALEPSLERISPLLAHQSGQSDKFPGQSGFRISRFITLEFDISGQKPRT